MFWKLIPSSVVEVRYNLNIFSCRSSYNTLFTVGGFVSKPLSEREAEVDIRLGYLRTTTATSSTTTGSELQFPAQA